MSVEPIRLLVFGGRTYPYKGYVHEGINRIIDGVPMDQVTIIHGACNCGEGERRIGTDYWAHNYCQIWRHWGLKELPFPAKWHDFNVPNVLIRHRDGVPYNARAGFERNQRMLDEGKPTHALGTLGGSGTTDMLARIRRAIERGVKIELTVIK